MYDIVIYDLKNIIIYSLMACIWKSMKRRAKCECQGRAVWWSRAEKCKCLFHLPRTRKWRSLYTFSALSTLSFFIQVFQYCIACGGLYAFDWLLWIFYNDNFFSELLITGEREYKVRKAFQFEINWNFLDSDMKYACFSRSQKSTIRFICCTMIFYCY